METIKNIQIELGEECRVDAETLHKTLSKLPTELYLELYSKMKKRVQESIDSETINTQMNIDYEQISAACRNAGWPKRREHVCFLKTFEV